MTAQELLSALNCTVESLADEGHEAYKKALSELRPASEETAEIFFLLGVEAGRELTMKYVMRTIELAQQ